MLHIFSFDSQDNFLCFSLILFLQLRLRSRGGAPLWPPGYLHTWRWNEFHLRLVQICRSYIISPSQSNRSNFPTSIFSGMMPHRSLQIRILRLHGKLAWTTAVMSKESLICIFSLFSNCILVHSVGLFCAASLYTPLSILWVFFSEQDIDHELCNLYGAIGFAIFNSWHQHSPNPSSLSSV